MKKTLLATVAMLAIVGSASATDRSGLSEGRSIFHSSHDDYSQSFNASNAAENQKPPVQPRQRGKTRDEVRKELRDHQWNMRTDPDYAAEWRSMYEGG